MIRTSFALLSTLLAAIALVSADDADCKCTADNNKCWPSKPAWDALSANLTWPPFDVHPPAYPCHDPNYNAAPCAEVQKNYANWLWAGEQPGGSVATNWVSNSTSSCLVFDDRTKPCGQGLVPSVGINATSVKDVQAAMAFANQYNLKVVVKAQGHDYLGRGHRAGSMMIWTHFWQGATFYRDFLYPNGKSAFVPAISFSPGTRWRDAYKVADDNNVTIGGALGVNGSVGLFGYALGGGQTIVSAFNGLVTDNILQVSVVLPNASFVTANKYDNADLFWAVCGGGGPSFGIVTSMTLKAQPQSPLYSVYFEATANSSDTYVDLLDSFHYEIPRLSQMMWSGYYIFSGASNYLGLIYITEGGNDDVAYFTIGAWIRRVAKMPGVTITTNASRSYPYFGEWVDRNIVNPRDVVGFNNFVSSGGTGAATASWLLPGSVFENETQIHQLSQAMTKMPFGLGLQGGGVMGGLDDDFNAVHPSYRAVLVTLVTIEEWKEGASQSEIQAARQRVSDSMTPLHALTPTCAAQYLNEPDILIHDFTQANWGSNYPRLLFMKQEIDPNNMLLVPQGVGSEFWDAEQVCHKQ